MTRTTSFVVVLLLICAYFGYNRFYAYPNQLEAQAESMLIQIANREEWMDVFEALNSAGGRNNHLEYKAHIKSSNGNRVFSEGFITYTNHQGMMCKEVVFDFKVDTLKNYTISDLRDCSLGEYH